MKKAPIIKRILNKVFRLFFIKPDSKAFTLIIEIDAVTRVTSINNVSNIDPDHIIVILKNIIKNYGKNN